MVERNEGVTNNAHIDSASVNTKRWKLRCLDYDMYLSNKIDHNYRNCNSLECNVLAPSPTDSF